MSDTLSPREVAEDLGVTVRTVQRWIRSGRLPAQRVGGRLRVSPASLSALVEPDPGRPAASRRITALLVANRGEIAQRIARSARRLGIRVIGVHLPDERPPAGMDATVPIPSYLDGEALIAVARDAGADAVHPGYGFLSENAAFAAAVGEAGLTWVGPPAGAIAAMGDKAAARQRVAEHGVPVVPGYDGEAQEDETLRREAQRIGLPLLIKPSAGGGGKGMRIVRSADDLIEELAAARREAARAFGDDRLILERYVEGPRHVEIQVLFDTHGSGVHLGERDCSTQRRHQKIIEESPGPVVSPQLRERMGQAALAVAASVGYQNAGTVEFLLADDGSFYFLEMNTRLQVEHPVTEAVTGRDLVADQLHIAAGGMLEPAAAYQRLSGHAIEARIYAEDPENGFLPATGRIVGLRWPEGVRIDTGVVDGDRVSDRFDPLLAKVIAHAPTRDAALDRLAHALRDTQILGVRTNLRFLRWLLDQPVMSDGQMRTDTLDSLSLPEAPAIGDETWRSVAIALSSALPPGVWGGGWRLNAAPQVSVQHGDVARSIELPPGGWTAHGGFALDTERGEAFVDVEGQSVEFSPAAPPDVEEAVRHASGSGEGHGLLTAPMPGRVISVRVAEGASVSERQPLVVIEAMKMEHAVVSPLEGRVTRMLAREGAQVERGELLAEVER